MIKPLFAGNAVYAKVRSLYGKHLTDKNFNDLLSLHSVNEVAEYLKTKTAYSEIFKGISATADIQRGQLETLLNNKLYDDLASISRFQRSAGSRLYDFFIMRYDTVQIINVLSSLTTKSENYFFTFPVFYNERSKLDLYAMAKAKSENELLEVTRNTIYFETLKNAVSKYRVTGNLTVVQAEFTNFLDGEFMKIMGGKSSKRFKKSETGRIYEALNDITMIKNLHRLTRFSIPKKLIDSLQKPTLTALDRKQLASLIRAADAVELEALLLKTPYREVVPLPGETDTLSDKADNYLHKVFTGALRRSAKGETVMFAYVYLSETEIKNIIHIIEGIRYGLAPAEIVPMLCGVSLKA